MPEGNDSWYTDSATVSTDKYETYILKELIPDVQQRYRTIEARYGRAIAGFSMGGYGAIKFGLKSPSTFVFAGSMSGAFGVTRFTETGWGSRWANSLKLFGPVGSETRKANDLFELIETVASSRGSPRCLISISTAAPRIRADFPYNRELPRSCREKKIPHEYREFPGDHSWGYWDSQVQEVLKIAAQKMRVPRPQPGSMKLTRRTRNPLLNFAIQVARDAGNLLVQRLGAATDHQQRRYRSRH